MSGACLVCVGCVFGVCRLCGTDRQLRGVLHVHVFHVHQGRSDKARVLGATRPCDDDGRSRRVEIKPGQNFNDEFRAVAGGQVRIRVAIDKEDVVD